MGTVRNDFSEHFAKFVIILVVPPFLFHGHADGANTSAPKQLVEDLLSVYGSKFVRPVKDPNTTVDVIFRAKPVWFADFDETTQKLTFTSVNQMRWKDEFLTWNPDDYEGIKVINFDKDQIWFPDVTALERLYIGAWTINVDEPYANVNYKGEVVYYNIAMMSVYCKMNVRLFPLDFHDCQITFTPYSSKATEVCLYYSKDKEAQENLLKKNGVWTVTDIHYKEVVVRHLCCPEPYTEIHYTLRVQRVSGFYFLTFGVPSVLLSVTTVAVFLLHPESGEKISLCVNNVLALILFQQVLAANMPPTGDHTPIVAYYFTVVIIIGFMSVLTTSFTLDMYHHDPSRPLPEWLRRFLRMKAEIHRSRKLGNVDSRDKNDTKEPHEMIRLNHLDNGGSRSIVKFVRNSSLSHVPVDSLQSDTSDISYQEEWRQASRRVDKILFCIAMTAIILVLLFSIYSLSEGILTTK